MTGVLIQYIEHLPEVLLKYFFVCGCFAALVFSIQGVFLFTRRCMGCRDGERFRRLRRLK
jgi:hypothetical protein